MDLRSVSDDGITDEPGSPYGTSGIGPAGTERKRRRGVIEKRRRDRINCSLYDLKRLIPDMTRKPGSAKLEKAEILQTTVDFLQQLYKEGHVFTSEARAVENRRSGFKECLLEVTRLLTTLDANTNNGRNSGLSSEELKRALLANLHHYDQQREWEAKTYMANIAAVAQAIGNQPGTQANNSNSSTRLPSRTSANHPATTTYSTQVGSAGVYATQSTRFPTHPRFTQGHTLLMDQSDLRVTNQSHLPHQMYASADSTTLQPPMKRNHPTPSYAWDSTGCQESVRSQYVAHPQQSLMTQSTFPATTSLGPNESQSTASPPFHSTPDDTELVTSPTVGTRQVGSQMGSCLEFPGTASIDASGSSGGGITEAQTPSKSYYSQCPDLDSCAQTAIGRPMHQHPYVSDVVSQSRATSHYPSESFIGSHGLTNHNNVSQRHGFTHHDDAGQDYHQPSVPYWHYSLQSL